MITKKYSAVDQNFVYDWADRWFQLNTLLLDLFGSDETPSPPPPTEIDEINYQNLRFWLIDHEAQFIPLWRDFYDAQDWALHLGDEEIADMPDAEKYIENPFFFCYRPENLYRLVQGLGIQSGIDIWEPSEHWSWEVTMKLLDMSKRVVEFFKWIDSRT